MMESAVSVEEMYVKADTFLEGVCIKSETLWGNLCVIDEPYENVCIKAECSSSDACVKDESCENVCIKADCSSSDACVKDEPSYLEGAGACGVSHVAAAAAARLYADHVVKDELVLGPELVEPRRVLCKAPVAVNRVEEAGGRACSVRLERLLVDAERRSCRVGLHTYTLRRTRETRHYTDTASAAYQCYECGKEFRNKSALRKHIHTHLSEPSTCFEKSALPVTLKRAEKARGRACSDRRERQLVGAEQAHVGVKSFKCRHCDYKCRYKAHLERHETLHTGEKPFKCRYCNYKCRHNLERHERIHTGEKPFKCSYCDYKCRQKPHLEVHVRIHTGEKPFKCSHCDYKCKQKAHLEIHEMKHTGEKPFKCNHCDYRCIAKSNLQYHLKIHTGVKHI